MIRSASAGASSRIFAATASIVNTGASAASRLSGEVVVGVLVGDQHGVRAVDGLGVGEDAGVEDDRGAVVLDADTGMAELRDPHGSHGNPPVDATTYASLCLPHGPEITHVTPGYWTLTKRCLPSGEKHGPDISLAPFGPAFG